MRDLIKDRLFQLLPSLDSKQSNGILAVSSQFELEGSFAKGEILWSPGEDVQNLYFNTSGALAEFKVFQGSKICHKIIPPYSLFWSDASFLLNEKTDTSIEVLSGSQLYKIPGDSIRKITETFGLNFKLANCLISNNIAIYNERIGELNLLDPLGRLKNAIAKNPSIVFQLPRTELAKYLKASRSTLFRTLSSTHRG